MSDFEKLKLLKSVSGETNDDILLAFLALAADKILNRAYPFGRERICTVPERYSGLQVEIACYLLNKRGAEGETSHSENGISRSYESASVPESMLRAVTPFCEVLG